MKTILVLLVRPDTGTQDGATRWQGLLADIESKLSHFPTVKRLDETQWQIPVIGGLPFFVQLSAAATRRQIQHRVLFLEETPSWVELLTY